MEHKPFYYFKNSTFILIILVFTLFAGCNKTYTVYCPKMTDAYDEWLPYEVNDSLLFQNTSTAETKLSVIIKVTKYEAKEQNRLFRPKVLCRANSEIESNNRAFGFYFDGELARANEKASTNKPGGGLVSVSAVDALFRFNLNKKDNGAEVSFFDYNTSKEILH